MAKVTFSVGDTQAERRRRMLKVVDEMMRLPPTQPQAQVEKELHELRRARKHGGTASPR